MTQQELIDAINEAENAMTRALRDAKRSSNEKALKDLETGHTYLEAALKTLGSTVCDNHPEPAPEPAPEPEPTPTPDPVEPAPEPTPTPEPDHNHPEPAGDVLASSITPIPSNFDKNLFVNGTKFVEGDGRTRQATAHPDVVGAFRFDFNVSHYSYNDPVVFPGMPGGAHLHEFWGNTETDAHSTYESLRSSGRGTTNGDALNRSGYWAPPLLIENTILVPTNGTTYYKRLAKPEFLTFEHFRQHLSSALTDEQVQLEVDKAQYNWKKSMPVGGTLVDIPAGLKVLTKGGGFKFMQSATNGGKSYDVGHLYSLTFTAEMLEAYNRGEIENGREPKLYTTGTPYEGVKMNMRLLLSMIRPGDRFQVNITLPRAWDGVRIDSPDHMSHMSHTKWNGNTGYHETNGIHNFIIPTITLLRSYDVLEGEDWTKAELASDRAMGMPPGSTSHADYWEAWDDEMRRESHEWAMDRLLNCSGGNMGSGRGLARAWNHSFNYANPTRIALGDIPTNGDSYYPKPVPAMP